MVRVESEGKGEGQDEMYLGCSVFLTFSGINDLGLMFLAG